MLLVNFQTSNKYSTTIQNIKDIEFICVGLWDLDLLHNDEAIAKFKLQKSVPELNLQKGETFKGTIVLQRESNFIDCEAKFSINDIVVSIKASSNLPIKTKD